MSRLASKTVFLGLEWKAFLAASPTLRLGKLKKVGGLEDHLQAFLVSEADP